MAEDDEQTPLIGDPLGAAAKSEKGGGDVEACASPAGAAATIPSPSSPAAARLRHRTRDEALRASEVLRMGGRVRANSFRHVVGAGSPVRTIGSPMEVRAPPSRKDGTGSPMRPLGSSLSAKSSDMTDSLHYGAATATTKYGSSPDDATADTGTPPRNVTKRGVGSRRAKENSEWWKPRREDLDHFAQQAPAVVVACMLTLMCSVPFGSAYFPIGWRAQELADGHFDGGGGDGAESLGADDGVDGVFPLPGKDSLGIRMLLFSTIISQIVFTFASSFEQAIGLQMVENVPFLHSFAYICIAEQGYGAETLSTLFFLFGMSSVAVGMVFFALGYFKLGRVVYFFPRHVLVGCIGGIGVFIIEVAIEVTDDSPFSFTIEGMRQLVAKFNLLGVVLALEVILRVLIIITRDKDGRPRYPLLAPVFYVLITPAFYLGMAAIGMSLKQAEEAGYFFPAPVASSCGSDAGGLDENCAAAGSAVFEMWQAIDFSTISWSAVYKSIPTMISLVVFSLMHVPINVPALAISTGVEANMNKEMKAHGYSNILSGLFGGLQNYLCYSNSVAYAKLGGRGKASSIAVTFVTAAFFFVGPSLATYIPRCMAGTLLLHIGVDLVLESVYDSYGEFDRLEYAGIWLVTLVMAAYGMTAGLVAGAITAVVTYTVQSVTYQQPVRGYMSAATLRSGKWNRSAEAVAILDDKQIGRRRIYIFQLQGHLFFGTVAQLTDEINAILDEKRNEGEDIWIAILDFSLVLGIDTSAAQGIAKIKDIMHRQHDISLVIYVTGSKDGFPCECGLSEDLKSPCGILEPPKEENCLEEKLLNEGTIIDAEPLLTLSVRGHAATPQIPADHICESLESALAFAEDVLIARRNPLLLDEELYGFEFPVVSKTSLNQTESLEEETGMALNLLHNLSPGEKPDDLKALFMSFTREVWKKDEIVWSQGSSSDSAKIVVRGTLLSLLEDDSGTTEEVPSGAMVGELGLVKDIDRLSTVKCISDYAVLYSLGKEDWTKLLKDNPKVARVIDMIVIKYLAHRVQHVSNRVFETRCLPI